MTTYTTQGKSKKAYEAPRLVVYGDVREITKSTNDPQAKSDTPGLART